MRYRLAILTLALVLLAPAAALAQDGNPFDGSLPPAQPTPAPTAESDNSASDDDVGRTTLYIIAGGVFVALFFVGWWISRDARSNLPEDKRDDNHIIELPCYRDEVGHEIEGQGEVGDESQQNQLASTRDALLSNEATHEQDAVRNEGGERLRILASSSQYKTTDERRPYNNEHGERDNEPSPPLHEWVRVGEART